MKNVFIIPLQMGRILNKFLPRTQIYLLFNHSKKETSYHEYY